jgi:hypothetical protein
VRNGWMGLRWAVSGAVGVTLLLPAMAAQDVQTAAGAQQFLAAMAKQVPTRVHFMDAAGRANYVIGKYSGDVTTTKGGLRKQKTTIEALPQKDVDKQLTDISASVLDAMDPWGRASACNTRITEVTAPPYDDAKSDVSDDTRSFTWTLVHTNEAWKYEPLTKFMSPAQVIDWSNAKVSRGLDSSITVTSKGQAFPKIHLTYVAGDPDRADRIEYAMKFLMMSCDDNAGSKL